MAIGTGCNKQNSRRSRKSESKYARQRLRSAKRKDAHVRKSSHGKFRTVEELEAHRIKVSRKKPMPSPEKK